MSSFPSVIIFPSDHKISDVILRAFLLRSRLERFWSSSDSILTLDKSQTTRGQVLQSHFQVITRESTSIQWLCHKLICFGESKFCIKKIISYNLIWFLGGREGEVSYFILEEINCFLRDSRFPKVRQRVTEKVDRSTFLPASRLGVYSLISRSLQRSRFKCFNRVNK